MGKECIRSDFLWLLGSFPDGASSHAAEKTPSTAEARVRRVARSAPHRLSAVARRDGLVDSALVVEVLDEQPIRDGHGGGQRFRSGSGAFERYEFGDPSPSGALATSAGEPRARGARGDGGE